MVGLTLKGLWKKQRLSCDIGWAVWEGLSHHQFPLGGEKKVTSPSFSIFSVFLFSFILSSFLLCYLSSFLPSPITQLLSTWHMSFQRQQQSFLFNQKERTGSHYFEENMKGWSGYSMLILDWTVAIAELYSLSVLCLCVHMLVSRCVVGSTVFCPCCSYRWIWDITSCI